MKQLTKKSIAWMLALLMIMSAFAGCASNQNVAQDTTAAAVTEAPSDETAAPVVNEGTDITDLPRNETLYLAGMQWGTVMDNNPMSTGSNNALVCSPGE